MIEHIEDIYNCLCNESSVSDYLKRCDEYLHIAPMPEIFKYNLYGFDPNVAEFLFKYRVKQ